MLIKIKDMKLRNYIKVKGQKGKKGLKIHNIYNINHNKGMTSQLI